MKFAAELVLLFVSSLSLAATLIHGAGETERELYIIYMGDAPESQTMAVDHHHNLLHEVIGDESEARESKVYSYGKSFNGFAARLLPHQANKLLEKESVVSVFPSTRRKLHTTRSWDFLGMPRTVERNIQVESNIVVGVLDTGISMAGPSFNDEGFGPPPRKWKGKCQTGANFTGCNNKVIGARYYHLDRTDPEIKEPSTADTEGHGTHTSSTAAGSWVEGANFYGLAQGTARGGVPSARIAVYKVCWSDGCTDVDILAAFDDAIHDGVNVISISIGGPTRPSFQDPIAIGSFHAMKKGILTSCSAGNDGPNAGTVQNVSPWVFTVGATGTDRGFRAKVQMGNGIKASGISVNTFSPKKQMYPFISGALASNVTKNGYGNASACHWGTLDEKKVKGKIVYCLGRSGQDYTIQNLGGAGTIIAVDEKIDIGFTFIIPATFLYIGKNNEIGNKIERYINHTKNPQAVIYKSRTVNVTAPYVTSFSSRGPNSITPNILKPDIVAPGLDILAAYSTLTSVTGDPTDKRIDKYNILSGTSMSCPHVAGAAAYVKTFHPDWSPTAIKSALMTTATQMKIKDSLAELGYGSGQINPTRAVHPGLVYDMQTSHYLRFLCREGYNSSSLRKMFGAGVNCSSFPPAQGTDGLNYPSIHLHLPTINARIAATFHRTVTHVGYGASVYKAIVKSPKGLSITVIPTTLRFDRLHQQRSFKVVLKGQPLPDKTEILSASLVWDDSKHIVRSPIVVVKPLF